MLINPLYSTIGSKIFPAPGSGASDAEMDKGFLIVTGRGIGENGKEL